MRNGGSATTFGLAGEDSFIQKTLSLSVVHFWKHQLLLRIKSQKRYSFSIFHVKLNFFVYVMTKAFLKSQCLFLQINVD